MAIEFIRMPSLTVHWSEAGNAPEVEFNFDPSEQRPWTPYVNVTVCECAKHLPEAQIEAVVRAALADMQPATQADAMQRIAAGEETVDEKGALAILKVGTTRLNDLRKSGQVPEPVIGAAGRNLYLTADLHAAYAAILASAVVARQASKSGGKGRRAPMNKHLQAMARKA
jgi:hypothetical protein